MASSITSAGSASGMDFESIIAASVQAKAAQLSKQTTTKKEETNIILSGVGKLNSALEEFQKSLEALTKDGGFNARKVTTDQPTENPYFSVTTKDDAANGSYDITVEQLSSTEKISQTFNEGDKIGKGTLTFTLPGIPDPDTGEVGEERVVDIEIKEELTAAQLRRKINDELGDYGVNASVISTENGDKLVIDSGISGKDGGGFKIEFKPDDPNNAGAIGEKINYDSMSTPITEDGTQGGWNVTAGKNAIIKVDGEELQSKTNEFTNISGLTINVNRVSEQKDGGFVSNRVTVEADYEAVAKKMEEFVNAYNTLMDTMDGLYKHNTYSDGQNNYDGGELAGDSMLRGLQSQMQSIVTNMSANNGIDVYSLGLEVDRDGKLSLDKAEFTEGLKENFNAVVNAFTKEDKENPENNGLLVQLNNTVEEYTKSNGIIDEREESLRSQIKDYEAKEAANQILLEEYEAGLRQKYAKLDTMIAGYNNSLNYLYAALG